MRILLVDNYDSFTYNLVDQVCDVIGEPNLTLVKCDAPMPDLRDFQGVIISPGPGNPSVGCQSLGLRILGLRLPDLPIFGVCLGHQEMGVHEGLPLQTEHPSQIFHGRVSRLKFPGELSLKSLFHGLNHLDFSVVRYHSLFLDENHQGPFEYDAFYEGSRGVASMFHRTLPWYGVQFHPESVLTTFGGLLIQEFLRRCQSPQLGRLSDTHLWLHPEIPAFFLDGQSHQRYSYFGGGQLCTPRTFSVSALEGVTEVRFWYPKWDVSFQHQVYAVARLEEPENFVWTERGPAYVRFPQTNSEYIKLISLLAQEFTSDREEEGPFSGGLVGYLGYEMQTASAIPGQAFFLYVDYLQVYDAQSGLVFPVFLDQEYGDSRDFSSIFPQDSFKIGASQRTFASLNLPSESEYSRQIEKCLEYLRQGQAYELCLTTQVHGSLGTPLDVIQAFEIFSDMRSSLAEVPYSGFLTTGSQYFLSFSPELCVSLRYGRLMTKPIKGTRRRVLGDPQADELVRQALQQDPKERSENLMITDLARHEFRSICEQGSVHVQKLWDVESFSVHQLVSTVCGRLRPEMQVADILEAVFPPGSMTGAPKKAAMDLLGAIEAGPRGIYSGVFGFISQNRIRLAVIIRSLIFQKSGEFSMGAGGAITILSSVPEEYQEMRLKCQHNLRALEDPQKPDRPIIPSEPIGLIETFLQRTPCLHEHFRRLKEACDAFGYTCPFTHLSALKSSIQEFPASFKIRIVVYQERHTLNGSQFLPHFERHIVFALPRLDDSNFWANPIKIRLHPKIMEGSPFKTTNLSWPTPPDPDLELLMINCRYEVTETTRANLAIHVQGRWLTPNLKSGLLAGCCRSYLIDQLVETTLSLPDFQKYADDGCPMVLMNGLRGVYPAQFIGGTFVDS